MEGLAKNSQGYSCSSIDPSPAGIQNERAHGKVEEANSGRARGRQDWLGEQRRLGEALRRRPSDDPPVERELEGEPPRSRLSALPYVGDDRPNILGRCPPA